MSNPAAATRALPSCRGRPLHPATARAQAQTGAAKGSRRTAGRIVGLPGHPLRKDAGQTGGLGLHRHHWQPLIPGGAAQSSPWPGREAPYPPPLPESVPVPPARRPGPCGGSPPPATPVPASSSTAEGSSRHSRPKSSSRKTWFFCGQNRPMCPTTNRSCRPSRRRQAARSSGQ